MGRLFVLFFLLPWWAYVPASVSVLWVGERAYEQALETQAEKVTALGTAVPEAVDLSAFDRDRDIHPADEVHVVGMIDHDLDYELVERTNGVRTTTRYLYMIFGTDEPAGSKVVRAALMLNKREDADFLESKADEWAIGATADFWAYAFNGFAETSTTLDDLVDGSIEEQGLTKAEDFIFIEPFFEGREVALAPRGVPEQSRYISWAIAALVALIGVVKRVTSVRARGVQGAEEELEPAELDTFTPAPVQTFTVPEGVSEDTPLGRLARKNARSTMPAPDAGLDPAPDAAFDPALDEAPIYASFNEPDPETDYGAHDQDADAIDAQPGYALAHDSGVTLGDDAQHPFPPMGDVADMPAPVPQSSVLAYYAKLGLAMLVVGGVAYDPSLIGAALPVAGVALFWLGVYVVFRKLRGKPAETVGGDDTTPQHARRPDGATQPGAAGIGGHHIDLTAPVRSTGRQRGVI